MNSWIDNERKQYKLVDVVGNSMAKYCKDERDLYPTTPTELI